MKRKASPLGVLVLSLFTKGFFDGKFGFSGGSNALQIFPEICVEAFNSSCPDSNVKFFLFTKDQPTYPAPVDIASSTISGKFNPTKPSKIIIHGYSTDMNVTALVELRNEYLKTKDYNIFVVDWSPLGRSPCYIHAVRNLPHVGSCTAQLIRRLLELNNTNIHLIGFSLGAQATNYVSLALLPYRLQRITGLDPALPGFITISSDKKLDKTDADFVDVYHTNAFMKGKFEPSGHVFFYFNGGVVQPGCTIKDGISTFSTCNHNRAPLYYAESINTKTGFYGWSCSSYIEYLIGLCPPSRHEILSGEYVDRTARGIYMVKTRSTSPYAIGKYKE